VKACFLADVAKGVATSALVTPHHAVKLLGTMLGGYNVQALVALLDSSDAALGREAAADPLAYHLDV
jgi:aconitate hydratase 2/2-methylisocitrate dehydratase